MRAFADLLDGLAFTSSRNAKLKRLERFFSTTPDPDRGYALAAFTDGLGVPGIGPALLRGLMAERMDADLFALSYDYVGDLAETVSLLWPGKGSGEALSLAEVVTGLKAAKRDERPGLIAGWLDQLPQRDRYALLKLITGGLRVGVSARLARTGFAQWSGQSLDEIEELWFGLEAPYLDLFAWGEGRAPRPDVDLRLAYRPMMLAHALEDDRLDQFEPSDFQAEWKWDGIRVQLVCSAGETRLYSRTGEEISAAFPDVAAGLDADAVLDGELLVGVPGGDVRPFNDLQKRLGRKAPSKKLLASHPAFLRAYDILFEGPEDLRPLSLTDRRARLEAFVAHTQAPSLDLSATLPFESFDDLAEIRAKARDDGIEGLMLKRRASPYLPGRPKGHWYKWKRDPLNADCVLMYAQRGHGKRSSFYSDFTFGCWRGEDLVPVGKAYSGYSDEELIRIDRWVRGHSTERFGPVRAVEPGLVFEVAFDAVHVSTRHKSGIAMRFPRIKRIRWDKPAGEADTVEALEGLI